MEEPAGCLKLERLPAFSFLPYARSPLHFLLSTAPASGIGAKSTSKARALFVPGDFIRLQIAGWPTQSCHSPLSCGVVADPGKMAGVEFENVRSRAWGKACRAFSLPECGSVKQRYRERLIAGSAPCNSGGLFRRLKAIDADSQSEWRVLVRKSPAGCGKQQGALRGAFSTFNLNQWSPSV